MEWVETTGRTVEEAKDLALDQLGVDEQEAEFEIVEEPSKGLFGRTRGEARVRARIVPKSPPPKVERRERRRSTKKSGSRPASTSPASTDTGDAADAEAATDASSVVPATEPTPRAPKAATSKSERSNMSSNGDVTVQEQADIVRGFLEGLVDAFGLDGQLEQEQVDEDTIEVKVVGDDLGLLIGPKGNTLVAVQELSRTVVQRRASGTHHGRVRIDVGGYRQRRREALERFTTQVAEQVKESGLQKALEPMVASDRKVVHDTANGIDGVRTISEGEDPRRRVVIAPE